MILLVIILVIAACIIPALLNTIALYWMFKKEVGRRVVTIEDFINWCDKSYYAICFVAPGISVIVLLCIIVNIITYPLQLLVTRIYNSIKHLKI